MNKFYGKIGYSNDEELERGVYNSSITEKYYYISVIRNSSRWNSNNNTTNDDIVMNNQFSLIADAYAYENFHKIRYVEFMGTRWKVTNIEVQHPRLILSVGGVYNGE